MLDTLPHELMEVVLRNTKDGVAITDRQNRIIFINEAFTKVTGYSSQEAIGKDPKILSSGKHDAAFYKDMWNAISESGFWQGEIWDRRKNGEVYLEHLSISAATDPSGDVSNYIAVFTDISRVDKVDKRAIKHSGIDVLTELANRNQLIKFLNATLLNVKKTHHLVFIAMLDIDDFKHINDTSGHFSGNRLLIVIAERLRRLVRNTDLVARIGGDEFCLVMSNMSNVEEMNQMSARILRTIKSPIELDGKTYQLTASMGVTIFPFDTGDADTLLRHADQAMYQAKHNGKKQHHLFDVEKDQRAQTRIELFNQINEALSRDEFSLYYQPKVNMRTGKIIGAEALIRWQHPESGLVSPGEFLPQIEHHDLILEIGKWSIRSALSQLSIWLKQGIEIVVSVNIAARQLLKRDFVTTLHALLDEYPEVPPKCIELEILESAALENTNHVAQVIEECKKLGVNFALDDFGTGFASLSYLRDIPADILKVDRSFVSNLLHDKKDLTLIEGIIGLATAFQRTVIAEGVETTEQGTLLMRLGCDLAQGYGIAKPMPAAEMSDWMRDYQPDPDWSIWADVKWEMGDFPLLIAQYDHINWVRRVLMYVEGEQKTINKTTLMDHTECRFGHWYYGYGLKRYAGIKEFDDLEDIHIAVHKVGTQIVSLHKDDKHEQAVEKINELLQLKDSILEKLSKLQRHVAKNSVNTPQE